MPPAPRRRARETARRSTRSPASPMGCTERKFWVSCSTSPNVREPPLHLLVRLDVGAAEAVDALLRIAHHEQGARARGRTARQSVALVWAPTRAAGTPRPGSGRCPGTRPPAGGGSARPARAVRLRSSRGAAARRRSSRSSNVRRPRGEALVRDRPRPPAHERHHGGIAVLPPAAAARGSDVARRRAPRPRRQRLRRRPSPPSSSLQRFWITSKLPSMSPRWTRRIRARCPSRASRVNSRRRLHRLLQRVPAVRRVPWPASQRSHRERDTPQLLPARRDRRRVHGGRRKRHVGILHHVANASRSRRGSTPSAASAAQLRRVLGALAHQPPLPERRERQRAPRSRRARWNAGSRPRFERVLAQQPRAERVNGADERLLDVRSARSSRAIAVASMRLAGLARSAFSSCLLERLAQLVGRLAGEGDGGDLLHRPCRCATSASRRPTSAVVLPEPAPASTRRLVSRSSRSGSRAGWSLGCRHRPTPPALAHARRRPSSAGRVRLGPFGAGRERDPVVLVEPHAADGLAVAVAAVGLVERREEVPVRDVVEQLLRRALRPAPSLRCSYRTVVLSPFTVGNRYSNARTVPAEHRRGGRGVDGSLQRTGRR